VRNPQLWIKAEHLGRYLFAADYLRASGSRSVLDAACGIGYGTAELSTAVEVAIGVDDDPAALDQARRRFVVPPTRFVRANLETDDLAVATGTRALDAVVSFETLEHVVRPEAVLARFAMLLRCGGRLICSVPNALHEGRNRALLPRNPHHRQLFAFEDVCRLLEGAGFDIEYRLGQAWSTMIVKRETDLLSARQLASRLSDHRALHEATAIRWFAQVLAYPTVENVEASYSMIVVAKRR
jgi:SAM-dependent methyltransferase